jgi:hypothetical protein
VIASLGLYNWFFERMTSFFRVLTVLLQYYECTLFDHTLVVHSCYTIRMCAMRNRIHAVSNGHIYACIKDH